MGEKPRYRDVAPRLVAFGTMEAYMTASLRQQGDECLVGRPIIAAIERLRNPGIVACRQHQGRHADTAHEAERLAALVVVLCTAEAVARCDEDIVVLPHRARL